MEELDDIDELKRLPASERVQKLKEIEEKNKKEIDEARKMITESLMEIEVEEKIKRDVPIPQITSVDVDTLFGEEEKEMFKTKRFESGKRKVSDAIEKVGGTRSELGDISLEESVEKEQAERAQSQRELPNDIVKQYTQKLEEMSGRVHNLMNMDQDHFQKYQNQYADELKSMYDNIEKMRKYESLNEQIQSMNLSDQVGSLLKGYKRGGV
jgi:hypothetical protein